MVVLEAGVMRRALDATRRVAGKLASVRAAYVFGSRAEGRAHRWSDIDVALFMDGVEKWDIHRRAQAMAQVQMEAGLDVEAHLFPATALIDPEQGSFAAHIIGNGIPIFPILDQKELS